MEKYISFLRGINVSGKNPIKMELLKKIYAELQFENIQTYVQSGNVVFQFRKAAPGRLSEIISQKIRKELNMEVPVLVLRHGELKNIIANSPFADDAAKDTRYLHVTLLSQVPAMMDHSVFDAQKENGEAYLLAANAVYLYCPNGYGKTKLSNALFEKKLKTLATTRNWKTLLALLEMTAVN